VLIAERDMRVTAKFSSTPNQDTGFIVQQIHSLYVTAPGVGGAIVSKSRTGINCPGVCQARFPKGEVTLEVRPKPGYAGIATWETYPPGLCRAVGARCAVPMETTTHVGATLGK
jgi:hypothetical protein